MQDFKLAPNTVACRQPLMRNYGGRTWDSCAEITLIDGTIVKGWYDTSWGEWCYFQMPTTHKWRKIRVFDNRETPTEWLGIEFDLRLEYSEEI